MFLKKKNRSDWFCSLIMTFGGIVYFLVVISVLNNGLNYNYAVILFLLIAMLALFLKKKKNIMMN